MTTIAFDGKRLAADTRVNSSFLLQEPVSKIFGVGENWIAGAGDLAHIVQWVDWFTGKNEPFPFAGMAEPPPCLFLVVNKETFLLDAYEANSSLPVLAGISSPYAIGSGSGFALGAMLAGKNAIEAVKIAAMLDNCTNDQIHFVTAKNVRTKK